MCNYPWSNKDVFQFVDTCHINQPLFDTLAAIHLTFGIVDLVYGLIELRRRKRKDIPIAAIVVGLSWTITFSVFLGTDLTFADRNVWFNLCHCIGRAAEGLSLNFYSFRHLEVIAADKQIKKALGPTKGNEVVILPFTFLNVTAEIFTWILPVFLHQIPLIYAVIVCSVGFNTIVNGCPHMYYAWKLRKIIAGFETSRDIYDPVQKKLTGVLMSGGIAMVFATIIHILWIVVPAINTNLYIPYLILQILSLLTCFVHLRTTVEHSDDSVKDKDLELLSTTRKGSLTIDNMLPSPTTPPEGETPIFNPFIEPQDESV